MFQPSPYQQTIFDWITAGRGDAVVNAVAGSGKTTTLVQAAQLVRSSSAIFVAFNKFIADELGKKLRGTSMIAKTVHSIGYGCVAVHLKARGIKKLNVNDRKYRNLAYDWLDEVADEMQHSDDEDMPNRAELADQLVAVVRMCQLTLTDHTNKQAIYEQADRYGLAFHPAILPGVRVVLNRGKGQAERRGEIDYNDMLWLCHEWGLRPDTYEWVFGDEVQDWSEAQLQLVMKLKARGGRGLFVGDPRQAIYGFAYAGLDSFQQVKERNQAVELPLSVCYRCPTSHIALAQSIVPQIEARDGATEGEVKNVLADKLDEALREGDLVLCRVTAPLISLCIKLIGQRVPARVRGRDIAKSLTKIVQDLAQLEGFTYERLSEWLKAWHGRELMKLERRQASEAAIQSLSDRVDGVMACYEGFGDATTVEELCKGIEGLFSDNRSSVWLSTVHRAKGLENERVFILHPEKMPLNFKRQTADQLEQEMNLKYVALTRAKQALYFVVEKLPEVKEEGTPPTEETDSDEYDLTDLEPERGPLLADVGVGIG
jgi:superfamily I DNA/RNA helicase